MPTTFHCPRCGETNIQEAETSENTNLEKFHRVSSSVSGAGFRLCGPLTQDPEPKNA